MRFVKFICRFVFGVFVLAISFSSFSCEKLLPYGLPQPTTISENMNKWFLICHKGYIAAFNPEHNVSDWVAFRLTRDDVLSSKVSDTPTFKSDRSIPKEHRVSRGDYLHSGYDRGHLAPATSLDWSQDALEASYLMTNIAPQIGVGFNRHIWRGLERKTRQWSCERGELFIITGVLYLEADRPSIQVDLNEDGRDDNAITVGVPSHFYKIIIDPQTAEIVSFIMKNAKHNTKDISQFIRSVDEIEIMAKVNFFPHLKFIHRTKQEVINSKKMWGHSKFSPCNAVQ